MSLETSSNNSRNRVARGNASSSSRVLFLLLLFICTAELQCQELSEDEEPLNQTTTLIQLQVSGRYTTASSAILSAPLAHTLGAFTLCYRIKIFFYRPEVTVFSFITEDGLKIRTDHNRRGMQILLSRQDSRLVTDIVTPLLFWSSFCLGFDAVANSFRIVFNGVEWQGSRAEEERQTFRPTDKILMEAGGSIVLGQDQDVPRGGFDAFQSFCGQITGVHLWSQLLSKEEMINVTSCVSDMTGDIINWDTAQWILGNDTTREDYDFRRSCRIRPLPYFLLDDRLQFSASENFCRGLGGSVVLPRDAQEQQLVYNLALKEGSECLKTGSAFIWLGMNDEVEEGVWRHHANLTKVRFVQWASGQPDGGTTENCAVMKGNNFNGSWADMSCSKSFKQCVMCKLNMPIFIRFRGICDANLYDDRYIMKGKLNSMPYFLGYYRSHVYYNGTSWILENIVEDNMYAVMDESGSFNFPMGRNIWRFSHGFCGRKSLKGHSLALTQCRKGDEFTCNDGTCIHIREVCDRREQCPDKSDELDCSTVMPTQGYQPTLPPPNIVSGAPLPVYLNLSLSSFRSIQAMEDKFTVEMEVRMIWKDQRLLFKHLRRDRQLNIILPTEAESIWVPILDFMETEANEHSRVDNECKITIKRLGQPLPDNIEDSKEARIYLGKDNYIRISRKYTITFMCHFNFYNYPFSTDYCSMIFRINKNTDRYVALKMFGPGVRYEGLTQLVEYEVGKLHIDRFLREDEPYSGLILTIQLKHMFATQVVSIFAPITLFNVIGFATFFYKWFDFQNRIMVTLTSALVMTTLFAQVSDSLPKTSYIKMMDIWFLFSIAFNFVIIIFHTMIEFSHKYKNPGDVASMECSGLFHPSLSRKISPLTAGRTGKDRIEKIELLNQDPYKWPKLIDKWGIVSTAISYILFLFIFWSMTYVEKVRQETWNVPGLRNETYGYPD